MKRNSFLINCSRGGIVNENDLHKALKNNVISGAASDVFCKEPIQKHPLFELSNFTPTSHIAGYTDCAINEISSRCANQIISHIKRKTPPQNVVN